jgi:hypothetical protein
MEQGWRAPGREATRNGGWLSLSRCLWLRSRLPSRSPITLRATSPIVSRRIMQVGALIATSAHSDRPGLAPVDGLVTFTRGPESLA